MAADVPQALRGIKALTFDVFGTVVDWRSSVHGELVARAREKIESPAFAELAAALQQRFRAITDDGWADFAQDWRNSYMIFTRSFVPGQTQWKDIDTHHHDSLVKLLGEWGVAGVFSDGEVQSLSRIWHSLRPWDDSAVGIKRLGSRFVTATLSNGNTSLLQDLDAFGRLGFQQIISTAEFGAYKPHPSTYLGAVEKLGCQPAEVAMVAAHLADLQAARSNGLRTIYVERAGEEARGPHENRYREAHQWVDLWVDEGQGGFVEAAARLGLDV